jgi:hypothetical protein
MIPPSHVVRANKQTGIIKTGRGKLFSGSHLGGGEQKDR